MNNAKVLLVFHRCSFVCLLVYAIGFCQEEQIFHKVFAFLTLSVAHMSLLAFETGCLPPKASRLGQKAFLLVLKKLRDTVLGKKKSPPGFLAITRDHSIGEVPGSVEMVPISFPELPKPSRTLGKNQKPIF